MASVTLRDIQKAYDTTPILKGISLDIADGEFMVLVGPSGCGKSTLLRSIAGLEVVDQGDIAIGERLVNQVAPKDRDIAMVFQNYALYPHMNVYDNIAFGLKMRKMPKADIQERVQTVANLLGLTDLLKRKPKQLSGGQRQRVALGRAIARRPLVFLMDEPLSNLDAKLRVQMRAEIAKLHADLKVTTVYVTHDQVEAMTMGQRIAVLNQGVLQQVDTPEVIYRHPANRFVAGFIGQMNFIDATWNGTALNIALEASGDGLSLPVPSEFAPKRSGAVVMGLRPEAFLLSAPSQEPYAVAQLPMKVYRIEYLGHEAKGFATFGASDLVIDLPPEATVSASQSSTPVSFAWHAVHWFDPTTGERL
jgi:multiple sugar transport system ATP-binding protein